MKKNIAYLLILALLCVAVYLILREQKEENTVPDDQDFAVENTDEIYKIFMADKGNISATLTREDGGWMINGKYKAMQPKVDVLLETIRKVRVYSPVSHAKWDNVIKDLATVAVKVELYRKGDKKPFKEYFVGSPTENSEGTYMIMGKNGKAFGKPYVTYIPGFNGYLTGRYFMDETEWRDTGIFDYDLEDIKSVSMTYPQQPEDSYTITFAGPDSFIVSGSKGVIPGNRIYHPGVVKYLSSFDFLNAEGYANDMEGKDTIISETPYFVMSVTDQQGNTKTMTAFHMPLNKRSKLQYDQNGNKIAFDLDKYYALINDNRDFVVIQDFVFGKVIKKSDDFLKRQ